MQGARGALLQARSRASALVAETRDALAKVGGLQRLAAQHVPRGQLHLPHGALPVLAWADHDTRAKIKPQIEPLLAHKIRLQHCHMGFLKLPALHRLLCPDQA
jgi:hypothetical protein